MVELFGTTRNNITMHLTNILVDELNKNLVCKEFLHTVRDGKTTQENIVERVGSTKSGYWKIKI